MVQKLLILPEVATMLRRSEAQLRWMRHTDTGPKSAKLAGRIMYREQDVLDWIDAQFEAESTPPAEPQAPIPAPRRPQHRTRVKAADAKGVA